MAQVQRKAPQKMQQDAIAILMDEHKNVKKMFQDYEKLMKAEDNDDAKEALVDPHFQSQIATENPMAQVQRKAPQKMQQDAIAILMDDHKNVKKMFQDYEKLMKAEDNDDAKEALVEKICAALTVHAQVEEEIFYPAVRAAIDEDDLMDEADVEHAGAKDLIAQLGEMSVDDDHYDAKVTVLGEQIDHHVKEEEGEMFPKARKAKVDVASLGARIAQRKQELQAN